MYIGYSTFFDVLLNTHSLEAKQKKKVHEIIAELIKYSRANKT